MHISHVVRDEPIVGCAGEREVKVHLNWVCEIRTAGSIGAKMKCGSGRDEGLQFIGCSDSKIVR